MKKKSNLFAVILLGSLFLLSGCDQGQKKEATEANVKKDIYLQLYSVRDDIKADYAATIAKVAEIGYTGVEAAGYNDGQFYGMAPA
ncbi:MAG TPA: sugar phosphate isomerase, partial [Porphyromonadaceae bacterium]|nr:sugar phosphate isomerase [Porphyromonadaceae bacterium]